MTGQSAITTSSWSRARIEELLRSESFNYQAIQLPHGLSTGGHDRSATANRILPADLSNQSLLDVGSSLGFFCFAARARGAGRVLGVDLEDENVRKARILAEILAEPVEFRTQDIEKEPIREVFDHVLCLNVLHHLADPIAALDRLIAATRRRLVLEFATLGAHDGRKLGIGWLQQRLLARIPMMVVGRGAASEGVKQFYLTPPAIQSLLRFRRGCFASVETMRSDFKERFIVIAHKHRIGHLLAVAGPAVSDTGRLIQRFASGELPWLGERLGGGGASQWGDTLLADRYFEPQPAEHERLILDYDLLRPFALGAVTFEHDPALDILATADETTILTLWTPPKLLATQIEAELATATGRRRKRLARVRDEYADPRRVVAHYRSWFGYCAGKAARHLVLRMKDESPELLSPQEWEATVARPQIASA